MNINNNRQFEKNSIVIGYLGENKVEKITFEIPNYLSKYSKKIIFQSEDGNCYSKLFDGVTSNTYTFTSEETQYKQIKMSIQFFEEENEDEIIYKTSILNVIFSDSIICDDDVTPDDPKVIILDELIIQVNKAITETNNLNISVSKEDKTTTVIVTKKDGQKEEVQILDGEKGEKGDKGDKGDPGQIKMIVVDKLPDVGEEDAIYLVPNEDPEEQNNYDEYIYTNGAWEKIGGTDVQIDLTDYVKKTDYATSGIYGIITSNPSYGVNLTNGILQGMTFPYNSLFLLNDSGFITKGTLNNIIEGKQFVSSNDYASETKSGVAKMWTSTNEDGEIGLNISTED